MTQIQLLQDFFRPEYIDSVVKSNGELLATEIFPTKSILLQNEPRKEYIGNIGSGNSSAQRITETTTNYPEVKSKESSEVRAVVEKIANSFNLTQEDAGRINIARSRYGSLNAEIIQSELGKSPTDAVKEILTAYDNTAFVGIEGNDILSQGKALASVPTSLGTKGILNSDISVQIVQPTGSTGANDTEKRKWANKTPTQIYIDVINAIDTVRANVQYVANLTPDTMLVSPEVWNRLSFTANNTEPSALDRLTSGSTGYSSLNIIPCNKISYGGNKFILYRKNEDVVRFIISSGPVFAEKPFEHANGSLTIGFHGHTAGLMVMQKEAMLICEGI